MKARARRADLPLGAAVAALAAASLVVATAGSSGATRVVPPRAEPASSSTTARAPGGAPHVLVLMMENRSISDVVGNPAAPYQTELARTYETATNSYGVGHDSLDNYLAAVTGRFFPWSTGDCMPGPGCQTSVPSLPAQLSAAGIPWDAYMGSMPGDCSRQNDDVGTVSRSYGVRHDPFVYFPALVAHDCGRIQPATRLLAELDSARAPDFAWLSPQICDDAGGDDACSTIAAGDAYLAREIPAIQATRWYAQGGVIVLTYDEGDAAGQGQGEHLRGAGNHVLTVLVSAATRGKPADAAYVNQFGLLGGLERAYHLRCLAEACSPANGRLPVPG